MTQTDVSNCEYIAWNLYGGTSAKEWSNKLVCQIEELDKMSLSYMNRKEGEDLKNKFSVDEDKLGKSESIEIKNDKEDAVGGDWSDPQAGLLDKLLEASNHPSLVKEAYLVVDGEDSGNLSINDVHYPHHVIREGNLVVHIRGVQAAFSRAKSQGLTGEPIAHIKKHYRELGLNMENFAEFGLEEEDLKVLLADDDMEPTTKEKFSLNSTEIRNILDACVSDVEITNGEYSSRRFYVEAYDDKFVS